MKKIRVPIYEYTLLRNSGMLTPREDVKASVSKQYIIETETLETEHIIALCSQNCPISFVLKGIVYDTLESAIESGTPSLNKTESTTLQKQPKALI